MYERREVYPNTPLALVTAEVRYPYAPRLRQVETIDRVQIALEGLLPIRKTENRVVVQFDAAGVVNAQNVTEVYRFSDRNSSHSAVVSPEAFTVETTRYEDFSGFLELITDVAAAINNVSKIPALERVGLRYIDEVRVPGKIDSANDWADWISPSLIPDLKAHVGPMQTAQGISLYDLGAGMKLQFQYAAANGIGIVKNEPLRRRFVPDPGPFFMLDFDSFWHAAQPEESQEFDVDYLRETLTRLHEPTGALFQACITDRLRDLFRRG